MVLLSKIYVQNLEHKAIVDALILNLPPKTYRRYLHDTLDKKYKQVNLQLKMKMIKSVLSFST